MGYSTRSNCPIYAPIYFEIFFKKIIKYEVIFYVIPKSPMCYPTRLLAPTLQLDSVENDFKNILTFLLYGKCLPKSQNLSTGSTYTTF